MVSELLAMGGNESLRIDRQAHLSKCKPSPPRAVGVSGEGLAWGYLAQTGLSLVSHCLEQTAGGLQWVELVSHCLGKPV